MVGLKQAEDTLCNIILRIDGGTLVSPRFGPVEGAVLLAFQHFYPDGLTKIQKAMQDSKIN